LGSCPYWFTPRYDRQATITILPSEQSCLFSHFIVENYAAEPPRKDSGHLLLNKLFLDACSTVYAVFPGGQENQGQPFVSKHFNVIDPLRTNNNLGRSVSKGMFLKYTLFSYSYLFV